MGADTRSRPLSWLSGAQSMAALREQTPARLRDATDSLRAEFEHFCAVAQQLDAGIGKREGGAAVERSIQSAWRAGDREEALANMALAQAALRLAATDKGDAALLQSLDQLAPRLYAPPIRHDPAALAKRTSFHDVLRLQIRDRSVALDLGGTLGPLGLKAEASLTERTRLHHNPVRAGDYKDVRLSLSGNLGGSWPLDALRDALSAQLAPHGLAAEVPAALAGLQSSVGVQGGGALTLLLRFYRPQYQTQADFPAEAAGFRLQLSRVSASGDLGLSASGGVPLQPGVSLELGLNAGASATAVLGERWGDNSLSAPLMHYLHLKAVDERALAGVAAGATPGAGSAVPQAGRAGLGGAPGSRLLPAAPGRGRRCLLRRDGRLRRRPRRLHRRRRRAGRADGTPVPLVAGGQAEFRRLGRTAAGALAAVVNEREDIFR